MSGLGTIIKFAVDVHISNKLHFLDVMRERQDNLLIIYAYYKPTDIGLYLKWIKNQPK